MSEAAAAATVRATATDNGLLDAPDAVIVTVPV
jgi:hypothetical protein